MSFDSPRIAELRRRVHADPASIAFAQLAEEYRRAGHYQQAVTYCRTGLARHPGYLSARVTLGRSLMELNELDDAIREFELVLASAPDNLAAIRSMAEIHQRRGALPTALEYYTRALALARFDPELEEAVTRIAEVLSFVSRRSAAEPPPPTKAALDPPATGTPPIEPLIDFDALLASLGVADASPPPIMEMLLSNQAAPAQWSRSVVPELPATQHDDPFAALERELGTFDGTAQAPSLDTGVSRERLKAARDGADDRVVAELEAWLRVLNAMRAPSPNA